MAGWFESWRQALGAVISAILAVGSLALDFASVWTAAPWQLIALIAFLVFAAIMVRRIGQLVASPLRGELALGHIAPGYKSLNIALNANGTVTANVTVDGRIWAVDPVVLDDVTVVLTKPWLFFGRRLRWPHRRVARAVLSSDIMPPGVRNGWRSHRLDPGDVVELSDRLFVVTGSSSEIRLQSTDHNRGDRFAAELEIRMLVPPQTVRFPIV